MEAMLTQKHDGENPMYNVSLRSEGRPSKGGICASQMLNGASARARPIASNVTPLPIYEMHGSGWSGARADAPLCLCADSHIPHSNDRLF
eukprot:4790217-Pyramimonas_sp.AAC.1